MKVKFKAFLLSFVALVTLFFISPIFRSIVTSISILLVLAILAWELSPFLSNFLIKPFASSIDPKDKAILITGCDSGFGHGSALLLNRLGFKIFAGVLNPAGIGAINLKERAINGDRMIILKMDVTKDEDLNSVYNTIQNSLKNNEKLWALVNNAGIFRMGPIELGNFDYFVKDQFDVNVFAVVKVTRKFSPLIRSAKGRIVVLSSIASRISLSPLCAYSMSKHAITAFCDCLRTEIAKAGVFVTSIEPYFYDTGLIDSTHLSDVDAKCWQTSSEEMKAAYGETNYRRMICDFLRLLKTSGIGAHPDADEVYRTIVKALLDPEPAYRYVCASFLLKPFLLMGNLVPREIFLFFYRKIFQIMSNRTASKKIE